MNSSIRYYNAIYIYLFVLILSHSETGRCSILQVMRYRAALSPMVRITAESEWSWRCPSGSSKSASHLHRAVHGLGRLPAQADVTLIFFRHSVLAGAHSCVGRPCSNEFKFMQRSRISANGAPVCFLSQEQFRGISIDVPCETGQSAA